MGNIFFQTDTPYCKKFECHNYQTAIRRKFFCQTRCMPSSVNLSYTFNLGLSQSLNYFFIFHPKIKNTQNDEIWRENVKNYKKTFSQSLNYFFTFHPKMKMHEMQKFGEKSVKNYKNKFSQSLNCFFIFTQNLKKSQNDEIL